MGLLLSLLEKLGKIELTDQIPVTSEKLEVAFSGTAAHRNGAIFLTQKRYKLNKYLCFILYKLYVKLCYPKLAHYVHKYELVT